MTSEGRRNPTGARGGARWPDRVNHRTLTQGRAGDFGCALGGRIQLAEQAIEKLDAAYES